MKTEVEGTVARNEEGRWRVKRMKVWLHPEVDEGQRRQMEWCVEIFEQYCVTTQSVRKGIDVEVEVAR